MEAKAVEINRQQREIQTLRVRNWIYYATIYEKIRTHPSMVWLLGGQRKAAGRGGG